jgi:dolichol-phosphate mannosyltransferase
VGPGRGRLPSGSGPTVHPSTAPPSARPSWRAVAALGITTVATAIVVAAGRSLSNGTHVALVAIACVAYLALITRRGPSRLSIKLVGVAIGLQTLVALLRPPSATQDLWYYAIYGRILAIYHASPYTHVPAQYPHNPFLSQVGRAWHHVPSVYGPAFTWMSGLASFVLGRSFLETRLFYQGLAATALLAACVLVWRRTRSADAIAFFALSPFTALYLVNGGRNDILVGVALLGAVVLAQRGHGTAAGVVGGLGALVKLTGIVGVVALVVALAVQRERASARRIAVAAGLTVIGAYLVTGVSAALTPMETAGALFSRESVWRLLPRLGEALPTTELALVATGVVVCWVLLRTARSGPEVAVPASLTALTLGAAYTLPGYVGWALPTAALQHRSRVARIAAYQAVVLVMAYEIVRQPLPGPVGHDLFQLALVGGPVLALGLLVALVLTPRARPSADGDVVTWAATDEQRELVRARVADVLVVVPTLDEIDNIEPLLRGIRRAAPRLHVLVVDDASPDGTADRADSLAQELGAITVVRRTGEKGLGAAYRDGFQYGLARGYDAVIEMDADLSHDPATLPTLVHALNDGADLVIGTRYISGGATPGWPLHRRLLSRAGGEYARRLLRLPAHDPTSGFRAFRTELLRACELDTVGAQGFAFQLEMLHRATRLGARVVEVPIVFRDRTAGESKLSGAIAHEALRMVNGLRRHPWHPAHRPVLGT